MRSGAEFLMPFRPEIAVFTASLVLVGLVLYLWSLRYKKQDVRLRELFRPKRWWPSMLRLRPLLRPPGFLLMMLGWHMVMAGLLWRFMFLGWEHWWWMP